MAGQWKRLMMFNLNELKMYLSPLNSEEISFTDKDVPMGQKIGLGISFLL